MYTLNEILPWLMFTDILVRSHISRLSAEASSGGGGTSRGGVATPPEFEEKSQQFGKREGRFEENKEG